LFFVLCLFSPLFSPLYSYSLSVFSMSSTGAWANTDNKRASRPPPRPSDSNDKESIWIVHLDDAPTDGWTHDAKVAAIVWLTANIHSSNFVPQSRFTKRGATFRVRSKGDALSAAKSQFLFKEQTITASTKARPTEIQPPREKSVKVKVVGLPFTSKRVDIYDAFTTAGATVRHIEFDALRKSATDNTSPVIAYLDSAAVFLEPSSPAITEIDIEGTKCRVFDSRASQQNPKQPKMDTPEAAPSTSDNAALQSSNLPAAPAAQPTLNPAEPQPINPQPAPSAKANGNDGFTDVSHRRKGRSRSPSPTGSNRQPASAQQPKADNNKSQRVGLADDDMDDHDTGNRYSPLAGGEMPGSA
jgi:hypothetical protein